MAFLALLPWGRIIGSLAILAIVLGGYLWIFNRGVAAEKVNTVRVTADYAAYRATSEANAAKQRAWITGLALNYAEAFQKETVRYVQAAAIIVTRFVPVRERLRALPAGDGDQRFPDAASGVLDAAIAAASANAAATAAGSPGAPAQDSATAAASATVRDVTSWGIGVAELYAEAREQVIGWNEYYEGLRKQPPLEGITRPITDPRRDAINLLGLKGTQ